MKRTIFVERKMKRVLTYIGYWCGERKGVVYTTFILFIIYIQRSHIWTIYIYTYKEATFGLYTYVSMCATQTQAWSYEVIMDDGLYYEEFGKASHRRTTLFGQYNM
jgi:hypothetical protein